VAVNLKAGSATNILPLHLHRRSHRYTKSKVNDSHRNTVTAKVATALKICGNTTTLPRHYQNHCYTKSKATGAHHSTVTAKAATILTIRQNTTTLPRHHR